MELTFSITSSFYVFRFAKVSYFLQKTPKPQGKSNFMSIADFKFTLRHVQHGRLQVFLNLPKLCAAESLSMERISSTFPMNVIVCS